ncbi:unnamed protein product [Camellia sinensis]
MELTLHLSQAQKRVVITVEARGITGGVIAGISVAGVAGALMFAVCFYVGFCRRNKKNVVVEGSFLRNAFDDHHHALDQELGPVISLEETSEEGPLVGSGASQGIKGITDKSVEFSYEELSKVTNDFSIANKIGQGGFGSVYYGKLRGEKVAIKKMDMQASKEFLAELKVLTRVHHLNLGKDPLSWSTRVQIALDSARGLEYIHEHIVADFGLTKLIEVGSTSLHTRLAGTFGYMPPEYAQYGEVSPKTDVYAFGVVLYELISAKEAITKTTDVVSESIGLVALFDDIPNQSDPKEYLCKLVDPKLGDDYILDSVRKMAQLARACTQENPLLRPSMRSIVVALMTLSSSTEDWDVGSFYENHGPINLMSGR